MLREHQDLTRGISLNVDEIEDEFGYPDRLRPQRVVLYDGNVANAVLGLGRKCPVDWSLLCEIRELAISTTRVGQRRHSSIS